MGFAKIVEIPDKYMGRVPSDFVKDAQRVMKLMNPPGKAVECRPYMDADEQYVLPQWVIHYELHGVPCQITFCAPFRYLRDLVTADPELGFVVAAAIAGPHAAPSAAYLNSKAGKYESALIRDKIEEAKANPQDLSDLV